MRLAEIPFEETRAPEGPVPPLSALAAGGAARADAAAYWLKEAPTGMGRLALHGLFSALPVEAASSVGARIAPAFRFLNRKTLAARRMEAAIARLRPDLASPAARRPVADAWWRNTVRTLAEFAHVGELVTPERLAMAAFHHVEAAEATGRPVIAFSIHLASWETALHMCVFRRICGTGEWFTIYAPQPNRFENRIIYRIRRGQGVYALPPSRVSAKRMLKLLETGGANLAFLVDEPNSGDVRFPLFGRRLPERCNLRIAIGLARRTGAVMLPCHMLRTGPARFVMTWHPPLIADDYPDGEAGLQQIAADLSAPFEPVVARHPDQWYMLDRLKFRDDA